MGFQARRTEAGSERSLHQLIQAFIQGVAAMEPDTGGVLLAELTVKGPDRLNFKMVGGAKDDPGLDFRRGP